MADKKISALTSSTTPLAGTEVLPIVQSGSTVKVAVSDLTAGRAISTGAITSTIGDNAGNVIKQSGASQTGYLNFQDSDAVNAGRIKYDHFDNSLTLVVNEVEQIKVQSNGNVKINNNNIEFVTSGKGIDFSANSHAAGMTSEVLTAYEEGTWTPTIAFNGGTTGITYSLQIGRYTRIGRQVTVSFEIVLSSKGSSTGNLSINGLVYAQVGARSSGTLGYVTGTLPYTVPVNFYVEDTQLKFNPGGTQGLSYTTLSDSSALIGSATYTI